MPKRSINWHEDCLRNMQASENRLSVLVRIAENDYLRLQDGCSFYAKQIAEAKRRGMKDFDSDRFMVKRRE